MKDFVTYEQALTLRELGFDEECLGEYFQIGHSEGQLITSNEELTSELNFIFECSAPLKSQAFEFFREKHNLHPSFTRYKSSSVNKEPVIFTGLYEIYIVDENNDEIYHVGDFNSYEEAESACLDKLIDIIKNQST